MKTWVSTLAGVIVLAALAPATAQERRSATITKTPVEVIQEFKLRHDPVEPAPFVRATRPPEESLQYIPVHSARPEPPGRVMTYEELKARENQLEAVRARHDRIGGRQRVAVKYNSVAGPPNPPAAKPAKFPCQITCRINPRYRDRMD